MTKIKFFTKTTTEKKLPATPLSYSPNSKNKFKTKKTGRKQNKFSSGLYDIRRAVRGLGAAGISLSLADPQNLPQSCQERCSSKICWIVSIHPPQPVPAPVASCTASTVAAPPAIASSISPAVIFMQKHTVSFASILFSPFVYTRSWKVREITSSCCSFVSLMKFTA